MKKTHRQFEYILNDIYNREGGSIIDSDYDADEDDDGENNEE